MPVAPERERLQDGGEGDGDLGSNRRRPGEGAAIITFRRRKGDLRMMRRRRWNMCKTYQRAAEHQAVNGSPETDREKVTEGVHHPQKHAEMRKLRDEAG